MAHSHDQAGHSHGEENLSDRQLILAVAINVLLTLAQIVGGILSGSLALIADALHNFSDAASLGLAWFARRIGRRPADKLMTFGYAQGEVVAALINLTTLLIIGFYLIVEAINRFAAPQPVEGWTVIWVAGIALVIDLVTAFIVYRGAHDSINMKAAFLHNVSDALASIGVIVAGVLIILYDLVVAFTAAVYHHHRQSPARQYWDTLDVGQSEAGYDDTGDRPGRAVQQCWEPGAEIPVYFGWLWHHADGFHRPICYGKRTQ